jgi:hypothetical protein
MAAAAPPRTRNRGRVRQIGAALLVVVVLVAGTLVTVSSRGEIQTYPRTALVTRAQQAHAPAWTRSCWAVAPWTDHSTCLHIGGRVVWVEKHDPDGDGDRHLLVAARLHVHLVKLPGAMVMRQAPAIGAHIDAVGWMSRGSHGRTELDTVLLKSEGVVVRGPAQG